MGGVALSMSSWMAGKPPTLVIMELTSSPPEATNPAQTSPSLPSKGWQVTHHRAWFAIWPRVTTIPDKDPIYSH